MYEDRTAVLGPLSRSAEPHAYDLCCHHASRLTVPVGWELLRVVGSAEASDDLVALADALRPGHSYPVGPSAQPREQTPAPRSTRRPHLQILRSPSE